MRKAYLLLLFFFLNAYSQNPAAIDFTYDAKDYKSFFDGSIDQVLKQADGKILIVGVFQNLRYYGGYQNIKQKTIARFNADMTLDESFKVGFLGNVYEIALQSTGKIIVGGKILGHYDENNVWVNPPSLVRLNTDGSLDETFISRVGGDVTTVAVQPDDKVLFCSQSTISSPDVGRTLANGSQDFTFPLQAYDAKDIQVQTDGKILIANGDGINRYNPNGSPDTTFPSVDFNCTISKIRLLPENKILVIGSFVSVENTPHDKIVRLNANGTIDTSFNTLSIDRYAPCTKVLFDAIVQPDGKTIIGGSFATYDNVNVPVLIRINVDGTRDTTFNPSITNAYVSALELLPNGDLIIGLEAVNINQALDIIKYGDLTIDRVIKIDTNGKLLETPRSAYFPAIKIVQGPGNTKLLLGSSSIAGHRGIKLIDNDGRLIQNDHLINGFSSTSNAPSGDINYICTAAAIQDDGKIIVGGKFTSYNGVAKRGLIRLNADYSIDDTFQTGTGLFITQVTYGVNQILIQPDGKILVSAHAESYNGIVVPKLFRLHANGQLDSGFNYTGTISPSKIILLPNGKIFAGNKRLNPDGSVDASFTAAMSFSAWVAQNDGKVLGTSGGDIIRVNDDGTTDATFNPISTNIFINAINLWHQKLGQKYHHY